MNIQLNYQYTDEHNIRIACVSQLSNPDGLTSEQIEAVLSAHLIAGKYFFPSEWLPLSLALCDDCAMAELESIDEGDCEHTVGSVNDLIDLLTSQTKMYSVSATEYDARKAA